MKKDISPLEDEFRRLELTKSPLDTTQIEAFQLIRSQLSECRESNSDLMLPKHLYYHYTTLRLRLAEAWLRRDTVRRNEQKQVSAIPYYHNIIFSINLTLATLLSISRKTQAKSNCHSGSGFLSREALAEWDSRR